MRKTEPILLVGAGQMAVEYAKVLKDIGQEFVVVGRGEDSAKTFSKTTGFPVISGGIHKWLKNEKNYPKKAIIAVSEDELGKVTLTLLDYGFSLILVEKPGCFDYTELARVKSKAEKIKAEIFVGYNRRFYSSVIKAQELIKKDGGLLSFHFEFTEWSHVMATLKKAAGIKARWFFHNSTHVLDLAFFLGGKPKKLSTYITGGLLWHPSGSIYSGAGISESGAPFSYFANWEAPGRWGLELMTKKHRLILKPLEKLFCQTIENLELEETAIDSTLDTQFKPGLYRQVVSFLGNKKRLCAIEEQNNNIESYKRISGFSIS